MVKPSCLFYIFLIFGISVHAQIVRQLTLPAAYEGIEANYPNLQNTEVLDAIFAKEIEQLDIAKMPSIQLIGDSRLQSESTSLDTDDSGTTPLPLDIDQPLVNIRAYIEANYNLLDGGANEAQKKLKEVQHLADKQGVEVERFSLRQSINRLFVNISFLREQQKLFAISLKDLAVRKEQITASLELGTILESELIKIQVKELEVQAQKDELQHQITGAIETLGGLIGQTISEEVVLIYPELPASKIVPKITRPEQKQFELQRSSILAQSDMIEAERKPKLNLYAQAGGGYPNPVNILDGNLAPYGIIGANFQWKIVDWNKSKVDKEILSLKAQQLENQQATFNFNLENKEKSYLAEVERLEEQIEYDENIAQLQAKILQQLGAQLEEGVINSTEYLLQVNAELTARQQLVLHQTELLQTQLEFYNERGAF